jgi:tagatose 1,6-diphosphate aldolase
MTTDSEAFRFLDPGRLIDDDLELVLIARRPDDSIKGWAPSYEFEMQRRGGGASLGSISLRVGDSEHLRLYAGHVGYGVRVEHRGHHYAARSCRLLRDLARQHGLDAVWITCDPDNWASRRTCELAGARFIEIVRVPATDALYALGHHWKCRYRLHTGAWRAGE